MNKNGVTVFFIIVTSSLCVGIICVMGATLRQRCGRNAPSYEHARTYNIQTAWRCFIAFVDYLPRFEKIMILKIEQKIKFFVI